MVKTRSRKRAGRRKTLRGRGFFNLSRENPPARTPASEPDDPEKERLRMNVETLRGRASSIAADIRDLESTIEQQKRHLVYVTENPNGPSVGPNAKSKTEKFINVDGPKLRQKLEAAQVQVQANLEEAQKKYDEYLASKATTEAAAARRPKTNQSMMRDLGLPKPLGGRGRRRSRKQ